MKTISLIDGIFTDKISVFDRGLNYGDGFFETTRWIFLDESNSGKVEFWNRHLKRLEMGCRKVQIKFSLDLLNNYKSMILRRAFEKKMKSGILKIIITRGVGSRGYKISKSMQPTMILLLFPEMQIDQSIYTEGVNLTICKKKLSSNNYLAGTKNLNRLDSVILASEFNDSFFEGIISDDKGMILEGTKTNIFLLKEGLIYTPKINNSGIKGIIREVVIEKNFDVVEKAIHLSDLPDFESVFITNSILKVVPVKQIDKKNYFINERIKELVFNQKKIELLELN